MLHGIRISTADLIQQVLQRAAVVKRLLDLRNEFVWNVDADTSSFAPAIEDVAGVLIAAGTRLAVHPHTAALSQTQRSERRRPQRGDLLTEPPFHIRWRFDPARHVVYVPYRTYTSQAETNKLRFNNALHSFATETRLALRDQRPGGLGAASGECTGCSAPR